MKTIVTSAFSFLCLSKFGISKLFLLNFKMHTERKRARGKSTRERESDRERGVNALRKCRLINGTVQSLIFKQTLFSALLFFFDYQKCDYDIYI